MAYLLGNMLLISAFQVFFSHFRPKPEMKWVLVVAALVWIGYTVGGLSWAYRGGPWRRWEFIPFILTAVPLVTMLLAKLTV